MSDMRQPVPRQRGLRGYALRLPALVAALLLLSWVLSSVSLREVWGTLQQLQPGEIVVLIVANSLILVTLTLRWRLFLAAQGYPIPLLALVRYRLTAFGISYFTPGPHFGGEPYQVYAVAKWHGVSYAASIAAVSLDKLLEMLVNFFFLAAGALLVVRSDILSAAQQTQLMATAIALLALPLAALLALWAGRHPLSGLLARLDRLWQPALRAAGPAHAPKPWRQTLRAGEDHAIHLCRAHPRTFVAALAVSTLSWIGIVGEFWLMTAMLETDLSFVQAVTALLAARVAILLPFPAALGALEASQALALSRLDLNPAAGVGLSLLIRSRDVLLGLLGLALGGAPVWRRLRGAIRGTAPDILPLPELLMESPAELLPAESDPVGLL